MRIYTAIKVFLGTIIVLYLLALPVVIISLWDVPLAQNLFKVLAISEQFPTKVIAGFTAVYGWATLVLAFVAFLTIEESRRLRKENRRIIEEQNRVERHRLALERIRSWAEDTLIFMTRPLPEEALPVICRRLFEEIHPCHIKSQGVMADAKQIGGNLYGEVLGVYTGLAKFLFNVAATLPGNEGHRFTFFIREQYAIEGNLAIEGKSFSGENELVEARDEYNKSLGKLIFSITELLVPPK